MTLIHTSLRAWCLAITSLTALASISPSTLAQSTGQAQHLSTVTLGAGMYNIVAQVARTPQERQIGLMFRENMPVHEGMLFIFEEAATQCFWMKNTLLPLSAAFVAEDGRIVNIEDMAPQTETSHCSKQPVRMVLEMNQGWFSKRGLKAGSKLTGAPFSG